MTPKNRPTDLPRIPTLPPIQMPDASNLFSSHQHPIQREPGTRRSPAASPETYMTAISSPDQPSLANGPPDYLYSISPATSASTTPAALRKSISVDSFVKHKLPNMSTGRHNPPSPLSNDFLPPREEPDRRPPPTTAQVIDNPSNAPRVPDREKRAPPYPSSSRSRGTSVSTNTDDRDPPIHDESDMERREDLNRRVRKGKAASRTSVRPGELPLPSRLPFRGSTPAPAAPSGGRLPPSSAAIAPARSSSLNFNRASKQKSLPATILMPTLDPTSEISIIVAGAPGCGKSTVIRKGLKAYGISEATPISYPANPTTPEDDTFTYTLRTGTIPAGQDTPETPLRVLEVDISALDLSDSPHRIWPGITKIWDGVIICYDVSQEDSFLHVEDLLQGVFGDLRCPCMVLACKSELERVVDPQYASTMLEQYGVGLVEVTTRTEQGKDKIRTAFEWLFKAILTQQDRGDILETQRHPISPALLHPGSPLPWEISRASSATPTASSSQVARTHSPPHRVSHHAPSLSTSQTTQQVRSYHLPLSSTNAPIPPTPASPTRARSTSDLLSEHEKHKREERDHHASPYNAARNGSQGSIPSHPSVNDANDPTSSAPDVNSASDVSRDPLKESRAPPWMTLDDLLNKLLFMAVSDDDPTFISHFLLTYRRFASPRAVLLAMQKRMRSLEQPSGDPMFACYAQMRICQLLDLWINTYPTDFAVVGASSALAALIKSILNKTYLLHYGAEFLPFMELVSGLKDKDASWALKVEEDDDDSSLSLSDEERSLNLESESPQTSRATKPTNDDGSQSSSSVPSIPRHTRERKPSLPLTAKGLIFPQTTTSPPGSQQGSASSIPPQVPGTSQKQIIRTLLNTSQQLSLLDPTDIAHELTALQCSYFLKIEPRHWLRHVLVQGKKDSGTDYIANYNHLSNHIGEWVVSLILCHDKPKARARQIEKFIDIANRLRGIHNYSGLRAIVAGINSATFDGDPSLELLKGKNTEAWKHFQGWDHLLQSVRSHQKYRMALRNTKGACIPALEIHLSDLIRAHEGNPDYYDNDSAKIHWAKFNMMARFIDTINSCQRGCRDGGEYDKFVPRHDISKLFLLQQQNMLMDLEMQRNRITPPDWEGLEETLPGAGNMRAGGRDNSQHRDAALLRKIFFW